MRHTHKQSSLPTFSCCVGRLAESVVLSFVIIVILHCLIFGSIHTRAGADFIFIIAQLKSAPQDLYPQRSAPPEDDGGFFFDQLSIWLYWKIHVEAIAFDSGHVMWRTSSERAWQKEYFDDLLSLMNRVDTATKFTMELEKENYSPFLHVLVGKAASKLGRDEYRKPTNACLLLNFSSNHTYGDMKTKMLWPLVWWQSPFDLYECADLVVVTWSCCQGNQS
ncbi:unnamed protein product [Protopolystoma xenopodis]|uniref:Uncharacterized protein n=1 Tax=Protopolystoma xenopodis TaxID=117903 RepID=A0A448WUA5_9PLAT|nr:unnamed protein product [Protopolystoma xenopodis]